jgi:hypothetical protein
VEKKDSEVADSSIIAVSGLFAFLFGLIKLAETIDKLEYDETEVQ